MVARMKETGNYADADAAAAWVASKTPAAAPAGPTWRSQDLNLFGSKDKDETLAKLHLFDPQAILGQLVDALGDGISVRSLGLSQHLENQQVECALEAVVLVLRHRSLAYHTEPAMGS